MELLFALAGAFGWIIILIALAGENVFLIPGVGLLALGILGDKFLQKRKQ